MKLPKAYDPHQYESDIYALWEKAEVFTPKGTGKGFSVVVPPPNANGNLHLGHALTFAIEDIAVRYHRLKGERALLLPGADHAGFETQVVYERELAKQGKSRFDYTREELYDQIYAFVNQNRSNYENQYRQLGAGVDWKRLVFTLDDKIVKRAYATFKKMWDEGLIYRGERLVNYCTFHGTAFADIEVEYKEEKSHLWYIRYPLTDGSGGLTVATTRPETLFGDTAVAVHPNDKRHAKYIGKTVKLPLTDREIPVIADEFVEIEFGTGAVKITPAHDPNDYEAGKRHDLPMITVISNEGLMTADVSEAFRNLPVLEAREQVAEALKAQGSLVKIEDHVHNVGHCYKCGTVIQPLLRDQWFVDMQPLAQPAIKALEAGKIAFYPASKQTQLITYLKNLRDWNLSRQIAWGIPIPAFQNVEDKDDWVYDERVDQEIIEVNGKTYHRDPDVFDTWFSSSSWPYATLNYGDPSSTDFDDFYPLDLMDTGADILYPWVSRMLMLGLYITGEIPFKSVYLHGLVLDEHGQKMSKSKGNVINPIDILSEYGSDALRMGIITGTSAGGNQPFGLPKIVGARNFCNKLWNIARYIEDKTDGRKVSTIAVEPESDADHWILSQLDRAITSMSTALDDYRFGEAYDTLYHFVWDDFADWYLEASKAQPNLNLLAYTLESILALAHPYAPFVTETIWQTLSWKPDTLLANSSWPTAPAFNAQQSGAFESVTALITEIRRVYKAVGVSSASLDYQAAPAIANNASVLQQMAGLQDLREVTGKGQGLKLTQTGFACWVNLDSSVIADYVSKLHDQATELTQNVTRLKERLANKQYVDHAPEHLVQQTRDQLADAESKLAEATAEIKRIKNEL
jgi:valyl-tRNA synthetase